MKFQTSQPNKAQSDQNKKDQVQQGKPKAQEQQKGSDVGQPVKGSDKKS